MDAIRGIEPGRARQCVLLVTGDVAFSGKPEEYRLASDFLAGLRQRLESETDNPVEVILIPGNHDCDFAFDSKARGLLRDASLNCGDADASVVDIATNVQSAFFEFRSTFAKGACPQGLERLFQTVEIPVAGGRLYVNAYNTAWLSTLSEKPGELFMPVTRLTPPDQRDGLVVSVFHHPYGWLEPNNARDFRNLIERTSDFALTGHEHVPGVRDVSNRDGSTQHYIEGGVLQDNDDPAQSWFHVIVLDLLNNQHKTVTLTWNGERYSTSCEDAWSSIPWNSLRQRREFQFQQGYAEELDHSDFRFSTARRQFSLSDLFLYPELTVSSPRDQARRIDPKLGKPEATRVRSEQFLDFIREQRKVILYGPEKSGKTTLSKRLQVELYEGGMVPVRLDASHLKDLQPAKVWKTVEEAFEEQYDKGTEAYRQLPGEKRAFLVDNFHSEVLDHRQKEALVEQLTKLGDCVVLFSGDELAVDEFVIARSLKPLLEFKRCEIQPFGYSLRSQLIRRWYTTSDAYTSDVAALRRKCLQVEQFVNNMLGAQLITPYPFAVLIILQQIETSLGHDITSASYSAFCELYVKQQLALMSEATKIDLGTFGAVLEEFAYRLYESRQRTISRPAFEALVAEYSRSKLIRVDPQRLIDALQSRGFLRNTASGIEFLYNYQFHYFTAAHVDSLLKTDPDKGREVVAGLVENLHLENNANIVVLLGHLSKDPRIMQAVLEKARSLLEAQQACDFDRSTEFVARLTDRVPQLVYQDSDPEANHTEKLKLHDARAEGDQEARTPAETLARPDPERYDHSVDEIDETLRNFITLNRVSKTVDVMGQMLRSYVGSIDGETKVRAMRECYDLTMRGLGFLYTLIENNLEEAVQFVGELFLERQPTWKSLEKRELEERVRHFIFNLCTLLAQAFLQRLTNAVGARNLELVFNHLLEDAPVSYHLIDYCIRTWALDQVDIQRVKELKRLTRSKLLAYTLLMRLTLTHFYLYHVDPRKVQQICAELGIEYRAAVLADLRGRDQKRNLHRG